MNEEFQWIQIHSYLWTVIGLLSAFLWWNQLILVSVFIGFGLLKYLSRSSWKTCRFSFENSLNFLNTRQTQAQTSNQLISTETQMILPQLLKISRSFELLRKMIYIFIFTFSDLPITFHLFLLILPENFQTFHVFAR